MPKMLKGYQTAGTAKTQVGGQPTEYPAGNIPKHQGHAGQSQGTVPILKDERDVGNERNALF